MHCGLWLGGGGAVLTSETELPVISLMHAHTEPPFSHLHFSASSVKDLRGAPLRGCSS